MSDLTEYVLLRDQVQKLRIAEGNRMSAAADGDGIETPHHRYHETLFGLEHEIDKAVRAEMVEHPAWPWLEKIHGVGPLSAALVIGEIDIAQCPTVSSLWRFAGWAVIDGARERPKKGEKRHYNARLKRSVWRLIDLQVKLRGPYRATYDAAKHTYMTTRMAAAHLEEPATEERALQADQPDEHERAAGPEQPTLLERAAKNEQPAKREQAGLSEEPTPVERAIVPEQPIRRERADVAEQPAKHKRAGLPEQPVEGERANIREQPAGHERAVISEQPGLQERAAEPEQPVGEEHSWTLGHCEAAARRKAAKLLLSHLWLVWREAEGLPVSEPFIARVPGHHLVDPWEFIGAGLRVPDPSLT